jgi:cell division protein FtsW (lipid II flippase)
MKVKQHNSLLILVNRHIDIKTLLIAITLTIIGLMSIYSATIASDENLSHFNKQLFFSGIGICIAIITSLLPLNLIKTSTNAFYFFTTLLLGIVLLPFIGGGKYGTQG